MWNLFDSRTLLFASALVSGAVAPFMCLILRTRKTFPGYGLWTASLALWSTALTLLMLDGILPDLASVALGKFLMIAALMLTVEGVRKFCGQPRSATWLYVFTAAMYGAQMYFSFIHKNLPSQIVLSSLLMVAIGIYAAVPLLKLASEEPGFGYRFTAAVFLFSIPWALLRMFAQFSSSSAPDLAARSWPNLLYYSSSLLFIVALGFSFFLLTNERLVAELLVANESLVAETDERLYAQGRLAKAQRLESIERLAGGISHIFNNQMCIIQLNCELLLGSPDVPDFTRQALRRISIASERSAEITARLLQFARTKALKNSTFEMTRWLHAVSGDLKRVLGGSIELQIESTAPDAVVIADADQLAGVLMHLAGNARHAMPSGGKWTLLLERVHLTGGKERELLLPPGDYICLAATDNGCGMDGEILARIFEPFYSTKNLVVAEGLGLASAFGLMQQCGGTMSAESTVGEGSTMRMYLPSVNAIPNQPIPG